MKMQKLKRKKKGEITSDQIWTTLKDKSCSMTGPRINHMEVQYSCRDEHQPYLFPNDFIHLSILRNARGREMIHRSQWVPEVQVPPTTVEPGEHQQVQKSSAYTTDSRTIRYMPQFSIIPYPYALDSPDDSTREMFHVRLLALSQFRHTSTRSLFAQRKTNNKARGISSILASHTTAWGSRG